MQLKNILMSIQQYFDAGCVLVRVSVIDPAHLKMPLINETHQWASTFLVATIFPCFITAIIVLRYLNIFYLNCIVVKTYNQKINYLHFRVLIEAQSRYIQLLSCYRYHQSRSIVSYCETTIYYSTSNLPIFTPSDDGLMER